MAISLNPKYLKRYKDIASLFWKYGKLDLFTTDDTKMLSAKDLDKETEEKIGNLPDDLENLGPAYIKLGQFFSTRSDMLPEEYLIVLERLQDKVKPFEFEKVKEIIEQEIPMRFSKAFLEFDEKPLGTASIGQVHKAVLRDGRVVIVKVQRPNISEEIFEDLEAMEEIGTFLEEHTDFGKKYTLGMLIKEFKKSVIRELDYRNEAQNLKALAENLKYYQYITVPLPVEDYTTSKVITMDFVSGMKVTAVSPLRTLEFDGKRLAEALFKAYLKQILIDGFYHADPHPGNIFLTDDNRIALLDLGMVGYVSEEMQNQLLHVLLAIGDSRGDEVAEYMSKVSSSGKINDTRFKSEINELVARNKATSLGNLEIGRIILELTKICGQHDIKLPTEFAMLGKTLLNLDKVGKTLNPDFNPNESIKRNTDELMREKMLKVSSSKRYYDVLLESKEFIEKLPARVNTILDKAANDEVQFKVKAFDEVYMMNGLQKIANRIAVGLILSSLVIGASIVMQRETEFTIFGYPGIAMLLFIIAIIGSVILVFKILFYDERAKLKNK
jgi:predicted unusual protein kinase regulating ubiquinone biosynthesis (AarF/ABC1/UbiB family)